MQGQYQDELKTIINIQISGFIFDSNKIIWSLF